MQKKALALSAIIRYTSIVSDLMFKTLYFLFQMFPSGMLMGP
nr:MAG TPA: hypothetical protein [Caudoviricetes sp.]